MSFKVAPLSFKNIMTTLKGGRMRRQGFTPTELKQPLATPEEREAYHHTVYDSGANPSSSLDKEASGEINPIHQEESTEPYPNLNTMSTALKTENSLGNEMKQPSSFGKISKMFGKKI